MDYEDLIARLRERAGAMDYDGWVETASDYERAADAIETLRERVVKTENIYCKEFITRVGNIEMAYVAYFDIRKITEEAVDREIENWGESIRHPFIALVQKDVACNVFGYKDGAVV